MNRLSAPLGFILFLVVVAMTSSLAVAEPAAPASDGAARESSPRPNLILCMTDDQGWGDVSYNGLTKVQTPNLDAMAAAGLRFNRFYAQQSCSPSRASVMTGRHPNRMGVFWPGMKLRREELTLAQAVRQAGYVTAHFGKWHLNGVAGPGKVMTDADPLAPQHCGFDETFSVSNYFETNSVFGRDGVPERTEGDGSEVIVGEALRFIGRQAGARRPFLAVVWFGSPHAPHRPLPADLAAAGGSGYYAEILGVDRAMGTLRAGLRRLGVANNTMLWFCSDNGGWIDPERPGANGTNLDLRGRKGDMWEGGVRVPGLIEWPGRVAPGVTEVPAGVVDIMPTILDLLDLRPPHPVPLDGLSLRPLLEGRMTTRPRPLGFWQFAGDQRKLTPDSGPSAWTDNRFKLVKPRPGQWELYDLGADRAESTDVAARHPAVLARMKDELEAWQQSVIRSYNGGDYRPAIERVELDREAVEAGGRLRVQVDWRGLGAPREGQQLSVQLVGIGRPPDFRTNIVLPSPAPPGPSSDAVRHGPFELQLPPALGPGWRRVLLALTEPGPPRRAVPLDNADRHERDLQYCFGEVEIRPPLGAAPDAGRGTPPGADASAPVVRLPRSDPALPERPNEEWRLRHAERLAELRQAAGNLDVLFLGDSITGGWRDVGRSVWERELAPRRALNIGIAGSQTQHVLWQIEHGALDGIHPRLAVLLIGVNHLLASPSHAPEDVARGVAAIVARMREKLPQTSVLLLGTFPKDHSPRSPHRRAIEAINSRLARLDDGRTVRFADLSGAFLDPDGTLPATLSPDGIHLSPAGYARWAEALRDHLPR